MSKATSARKPKDGGDAPGRKSAEAGVLEMEPPRRDAGGVSIAREEVARRAYTLFLQRGGQHGDDLNDWLQAEAQLRTERTSAKGARSR